MEGHKLIVSQTFSFHTYLECLAAKLRITLWKVVSRTPFLGEKYVTKQIFESSSFMFRPRGTSDRILSNTNSCFNGLCEIDKNNIFLDSLLQCPHDQQVNMN